MRINTSDKAIAYLTLLSGLAISGVAEYYSIMGLIAIYPAAFWPIVVMGVVLGFGKISGTVWLKQNWNYAPLFLKSYILPAIAVLMMITSLGVFGFLSKAHSDQSLVSGDVQSKIAIYDEKIKTAKDNIDANRKALRQMDEAVDQSMARSNDEKGADKAVAIRRGQQKERQRLQSEIAAEQKAIAVFNEEAAPIRAEVRKVEAEVGPIKYIAHLLYGENPDANILEKAVIWVTVLIVIVLDPLAVILLLASQFSFQRFRQMEEDNAEGDSPVRPEPVVDDPVTTVTLSEPVAANDTPFEDLTEANFAAAEAAEEAAEPIIELVEEPKKEIVWASKLPESNLEIPHTYVPEVKEEVVEQEDHEILDNASVTDKEAMTLWKQDHPDSSLKLQRRLFERGMIPKLPWEDYHRDEAAEEAAKWAAENPETEEAAKAEEWASEQVKDLERPGDYLTPPDEVKKKDNVDGESGKATGNEIPRGLAGYVQNAEQSSITLWQRVQKAKE